MAAGAGGALTDGENGFGPVGMRGAFCVGLTDSEGAGAVGAVVVSVVVSFSLSPALPGAR
jgi:hypothetical protein